MRRFLQVLSLLAAAAVILACTDKIPTSSIRPGSRDDVKLVSAKLLPPARLNDSTDHLDLVIGNPNDTSNVEALITLEAYDTRGRLATKTGNPSYLSADPSVAIVDGYGVVRGQREGETLVTASVQGVSASLLVCVTDKSLPVPKVVVPDPVAPVVFGDSASTPVLYQWIVKQGTILQAFRADGSQISAPCLHWSSSDPTQIAIARNGAVTPLVAYPRDSVVAHATIGSTGAP